MRVGANCSWCGWGDHVKPSCKTSTQAMGCDLNKENVRKYRLRFKDAPVPSIICSTRYQGRDGKGDSFEFMERIE